MTEFKLPDMSCGHCVGAVTQALRQVDPACDVNVDLAAKVVRVESTADRQALVDALAQAGYTPG